MSSHSVTLYSAQQAHQSLAALWAWAKPRLIAGQRLHLSVKDQTRSLEQNAKLHALLTDISRSVEWAGKKRSVDVWKRLVTAAWLRARGESIEVLPALDGHGVDIVWRPTSKLSVAECSELLEWTIAWAAQAGIETQ
ncbi:MAG: hypothetical protein RLZZ373_2625 [Pseudomonadota bacterium]|jgi:hypothetical protein